MIVRHNSSHILNSYNFWDHVNFFGGNFCDWDKKTFYHKYHTLLIMVIWHEWIFVSKTTTPLIWTIHAHFKTPRSLAPRPTSERVSSKILPENKNFIIFFMCIWTHVWLIIISKKILKFFILGPNFCCEARTQTVTKKIFVAKLFIYIKIKKAQFWVMSMRASKSWFLVLDLYVHY